jgi:SHS2 domain-containing protein
VTSSDARLPYEILEHTADIGLRAWGETREALFENCALGLADILDRR